MSTVIIRLYIHIYILIVFHSSCQFTVVFFCTSVAFHIKIRNDCSEQVCDSCWIRQGGMNPSGNACLSKVWMQRPDVWIYTFELVIRLSKVKQSFNFQLLTDRSSECWAAVWPPSFSSGTVWLSFVDFSRDNLLSSLLESVIELNCHNQCIMNDLPGRYTTLGVVLFSFDGLWWGQIVHVIQGLTT